jgi:hypothetical protein
MSDSIFQAITEVLNVPPKLVKVFCRDGYSLNELCDLKLIGGIFMNPSTNESMLMRGPFSGAVNMKCMSSPWQLSRGMPSRQWDRGS